MHRQCNLQQHDANNALKIKPKFFKTKNIKYLLSILDFSK